MQSIWIGLLGILSVCTLNTAVPVDIIQQNNDAESRIIIPPELPPHHFELLKEKFHIQANCSKDKAENDSTPLNFLRASEDAIQNITTTSPQPIVAFEGNKQIPIYITIPIYIGSQVPQVLGVDNGAVIAGPAFNVIPEVIEARESSKERKKALKKLLRDTYMRSNEEIHFRGKKRVHRQKPHRIYRD